MPNSICFFRGGALALRRFALIPVVLALALKWQLKGDSNAAKMFTGPSCVLCADQQWEIRKKNIN